MGLLQVGSVELKWKRSNPAGTVGTIYEVKRQIGALVGGVHVCGATGVTTFTDDSLPAGASLCTYQVTAVRSTARGNPAQYTVNFGVGGGLTIASISSASDGANMKMAA